MNKPAWLLALTLLFASACQQLPPAASNDWQADWMLVVIDDPRPEHRTTNSPQALYDARLSYDADPALRRLTNAIITDHELVLVEQWPLVSLGVHCFIIQRPTEASLNRLRHDKRVNWVQDYNQFTMLGSAAGDRGSSHLHDQFRSDYPATGHGIQIAVIDTGADLGHRSLQNADLDFFNFIDDRRREETHGMAVVGLLAAAQDGKNPVRGLAPDAKINLLRACAQNASEATGRCTTFSLALALQHTLSLSPDILNLSLSGPEDRLLDMLISRLTTTGTLIIAAHDDNRALNQRFPGPVEGVVYAYGTEAVHAGYSPGDAYLLAPRHVLSLSPKDRFDFFVGHSFAVPQITAMAACLMQQNPGRSRADVVTELRSWLSSQYL